MSGRALPPSSGFSGDDGAADPELAQLLVDHSEGRAPLSALVARLAHVRLLVPVLASLDVQGETEGGLHVDKEASAGVVALEALDGRKALPVFSSVETMGLWRTDARPVPVEGPRAALSAVSEGWQLLVVDPGGPAMALVPRPAVFALAQGRDWVPAVEGDDVDPAVRAEVARVIGAIPHVRAAEAHPGRSAELAVLLRLDAGLDRAGLDAVIQAVNTALSSSAVFGERVDSVELRIGTA